MNDILLSLVATIFLLALAWLVQYLPGADKKKNDSSTQEYILTITRKEDKKLK